MGALEIELIFNRKDFEEIYFNENQGYYFKSKANRKAFLYLALSIIIFSFILYYNFEDSSGTLVPLFFSGIIVLFCLKDFTEVSSKTWELRRKVRQYLDSVEKYKSHRIILNDEDFKIIQDDNIHIEKWSDIKSSDITKSFVHMVSTTETYLVPKNSMSNDEFMKFKKFIETKTNPKIYA
ncbi:MAG: hypothetical protein AAFX55_10225 [Bacteroidota bacterium]